MYHGGTSSMPYMISGPFNGGTSLFTMSSDKASLFAETADISVSRSWSRLDTMDTT